MKRIHLICNAHLDPYWLWEWEEGAAEAVSTFRTAANFCEEFDGYVFNHNEVILYQWVEEYEPELFERIKRLVRLGRWHIMGGWYLQPDCNMPSGESFVRQALSGRRYFHEKFGSRPSTAINFDPFGHTRGLVQILKKSGYDSYIYMRPSEPQYAPPDWDFTWVGYDGSEVLVHHIAESYNTFYGRALEKIKKVIDLRESRYPMMILWGMGNHGGGASRIDLEAIQEFIAEQEDTDIVHSRPEDYFHELRQTKPDLPRVEADLNPWGVGCYTSMVRIKQKHRHLENDIYMAEKMVSAASLQGLMEYPEAEFHEAQEALMTAQFHDILPGSSVQNCEDAGLRLLDHGLEIMSRVKARAFFRLANGQPQAEEDHIPVFVYNPHPFPVHGVFEVEFNLADAKLGPEVTTPIVYQDGRRLPCQTEKEVSNLIECDWRKRSVFYAELAPSQMNRFDCSVHLKLPGKPRPALHADKGHIHVQTERLEVVVSCETGLLECYAIDGVNYIGPSGMRPRVMDDNEDPWSQLKYDYRRSMGQFQLLDAHTGAMVSGIRPERLQGSPLPTVRVVEDGEVRTVVETIMGYGYSFLVMTYYIPKHGTELYVHVRVHWNEKDRCLKLAVPVGFDASHYMGQVAYGRDVLPGHEHEVIAQKWVAAVGPHYALTCINDGSYGSDWVDNEMRLTLLRSPAYSAAAIDERPLVPPDRYTPRIDQGEREFNFWFNGGPAQDRLDAVDREAIAHNEKPFALSFFPHGQGERPWSGLRLSDDVVQLSAFKRGAGTRQYIIRLFEPTGTPRKTTINLDALNVSHEVELDGFEVKTFSLEPATGALTETNLMEEPL
jgi:alpha-mannosidase